MDRLYPSPVTIFISYDACFSILYFCYQSIIPRQMLADFVHKKCQFLSPVYTSRRETFYTYLCHVKAPIYDLKYPEKC